MLSALPGTVAFVSGPTRRGNAVAIPRRTKPETILRADPLIGNFSATIRACPGPSFGMEARPSGLDDADSRRAGTRMDESVVPWLLAFVQQTSDLVVVTDPAGNTVYINDAARNHLGLSAAQAVGMTTQDLFTESAFDRYLDEVGPALRRSGVWSGVIPMRTASGASRELWMTVTGQIRPGGQAGWLVMSGRDVTQWQAHHDELSWRATHDELTGVARRGLLLDRLDIALGRARRTGDGVVLLYIDVDGLKAVNDAYGHQRRGRAGWCWPRPPSIGSKETAPREIDTVARQAGTSSSS